MISLTFLFFLLFPLNLLC